jgi:hypothetical protein
METWMSDFPALRRRRFLQGAAVLAVAQVPGWRLAVAKGVDDDASAGVTPSLARYIVAARDTALPPDVSTACKNHILDTLATVRCQT